MMTREHRVNHVWASSEKESQLKFLATFSRAEVEQVHGPSHVISGVFQFFIVQISSFGVCRVNSINLRRVSERRKPSTFSIFLCLLLPRILSALYNIIHDCDEVYNYWEPLHFLLYGHGMQTWEYRYVPSRALHTCQKL